MGDAMSVLQGDSQVLACLEEYLSIELTGHKQYLLHARTCARWGFHRLAGIQQAYSEEETHHAGRLLDRLLMLEGTPSMADARPLTVETSVENQLRLDRDLVSHAIDVLRGAVGICEQREDFVTRAFFAEMLDDEERHLHWLDTELAMIQRIGLSNYLQSQV